MTIGGKKPLWLLTFIVVVTALATAWAHYGGYGAAEARTCLFTGALAIVITLVLWKRGHFAKNT